MTTLLKGQTLVVGEAETSGSVALTRGKKEASREMSCSDQATYPSHRVS